MKKLFFVILMTIVSAFILTPAAMAIDNGIFCWNLARAATPDPIHGDFDFEFTWSELTDPLPGGPTAGFFSGKLHPVLAGPYTIFDVISGVLIGGGLAPIPCPIP
jgi:hypothetical protein